MEPSMPEPGRCYKGCPASSRNVSKGRFTGMEGCESHVFDVASLAGKLVVPGMPVYNASKFAAGGLSVIIEEQARGRR
jgi:NADP-dependent 3-hydroxy acid dehydrogenase YdfG